MRTRMDVVRIDDVVMESDNDIVTEVQYDPEPDTPVYTYTRRKSHLHNENLSSKDHFAIFQTVCDR